MIKSQARDIISKVEKRPARHLEKKFFLTNNV